MTDQQNQNPKADPAKDRFEAEFDALPLDKKFARLFKMEAAVLTETVEYVFNSPTEAFGMVGDAISDLAGKVEAEIRKAAAANKTHCHTEQAEAPPPPPNQPKAKGGPKRKERAAGTKCIAAK